MPKTIRHCYFEHLTFENLLNAHNRCCRSKKKSYERLRFELDLETNMVLITVENIENLFYMSLKNAL